MDFLSFRSLLPEVNATMFEHWVLAFGREVIVASSHHPLVSGFYKLLATCLTLCKEIEYFKVVLAMCSTVLGRFCEESHCLQDVDMKSADSMETDAVTDRITCYMLFRKFTREVACTSS